MKSSLTSLRRFISHVLTEKRRHEKEGVEFDAAEEFRKHEGDAFAFVHYSDLNKLGINPRSSYDTPVGIYGYPLNRFNVDDILNGKVPFAGNRKYIHLFVVRPQYTDSVVFVERDGYSFNDIDFKKRWQDIINSYNRVNDNEFIDLENQYDDLVKFYSESDDRFTRTLVDSLKDVSLERAALRHVSKDSYNPEKFEVSPSVWEYIPKIAELMEKYVELEIKNRTAKNIEYAAEGAKLSTNFARYWNVTRILTRNAKKWASYLVKDGIAGIVDYGSGIIHDSEPTQAVFFSKAFVEHIATYEKQSGHEDIKKETNKIY